MRLILATILAVTTLTACGTSDGGDALDWSSTDDPVGADTGLVWADRETGEVHLADGTTLSAGRSISSFVLAGGGAYAATDEDDPTLLEVTPDGVRATGAHTGGATASPDGRYLAYVDTTVGPLYQEIDDGQDVHLLTYVVVDLQAGKEIVRSTRGMGDPEEDDLTDLYEDASYGVLGMTDETAWIDVAADGVLAVDLASGDVSTVPRDVETAETPPWDVGTISPPTSGGDANPDRTWGIYHVTTEDPELSDNLELQFSRDELESADGRRVVPRPDALTWHFEQWVDSTTVAGFANTMLDDPARIKDPMPSSLLTCTVPDGSCTIVPDSEDAILPSPSRG